MKMKFEVTKTAGVWVAGHRSPGEGKTIELTEEQAEYALISGELRRPDVGQPETAPTIPKTRAKRKS